MEMLYVVHRKPNLNSFSIKPEILHTKVSTANTVAFSTNYLLNESSNSLGHHVYVADLNIPWFPFLVTSTKYNVSVLEWDISGRYLLIGDQNGDLKIWAPKDNLISEWITLYSIVFAGEHIIRAQFFHNGKKVQYLTDKKDQALYSEKFQNQKFLPSVKNFGGVPAEGCVVITSTGMLGAFLINSEQQAVNNNYPIVLEATTESLGPTRNYFTTADIGYSKSGQFLIAVTNGESRATSSIMVQCYRVVIQKKEEKLAITSHSLPSFFLEGAGRDIDEVGIASLRWLSPEDPDSLVVVANHQQGSFVEIWGLKEDAKPIHKLFQSNKSEHFKTVVWVHNANLKFGVNILSLTITKLQVSASSGHIFLGMADNNVVCLQKDSLKRVANLSLSYSWRANETAASKQARVSKTIAALDVTYMGHLLVATDTTGQLYTFKCTFQTQDQIGTMQNIAQTVNLLEFCLVNGYDALDILLNLKSSTLDALVEKISDNFNRQPSAIQQYYYVNFLTVKINLYRLSVSGQSKAQDLNQLLMLHSILIAFKSLLRPSHIHPSYENGPAENLAMVLALESIPDVDKVLLNLDAKDFATEPSTLQSLQQLIQYVADLALNILTKLPEHKASGGLTAKNQGYDISKDIVALNSIRELLVMIRIWGLLRPQCLPVFSRSSDNLDILATLFRLLTKLALNPNDPDELLLDECCLLSSQVLIPHLNSLHTRPSVTSPLLSHISLPMHFDYNVESDEIKFWPDGPFNETDNETYVDSIRYLQLGKYPQALRCCTRCGATSMTNSTAKTKSAAMKSWEQRWAKSCRCGGSWRFEETV